MRKSPRFYLAIFCAFSPILKTEAASSPSPNYAWTRADPNTVLRWKAEVGEVSFNVYFGTEATLGVSAFKGNQSGTVFCPGTLKPDTRYYWRIDSVNSSNAVTTGAVWHFDTGAVPGPIERVGLMPSEPPLYALRNWKQVALMFDDRVTDLARTGGTEDFLPIAGGLATAHNFDIPFFWLPSFVGSLRRDTGAFGTMANVVGASLVGVDKSDFDVRNDVAAMASYFTIDSQWDMLGQSTKGGVGGSFWYRINANILFWQLAYLYRDVAESTEITSNDDEVYTMDDIMDHCAGKWHQATVVMAGNYAHNSFNFDPAVMAPTDDGTPLPHSAGGIAWLQYMAFKKRGDVEYLADADEGLKFLHALTYNPAHDFILPYGVYCAARMNAELGRNYDVGKFMAWHFDLSSDSVSEDVNENTGVEVGSYGSYPVDGLTGKPGLKKVYAANSHVAAGALAPVARYDQRFARDIGKWLLNVAANSRFFYSGTLPAENQTNKEWYLRNDLTPDGYGSLTYEFLSNVAWTVDRPTLLASYPGTRGTIVGTDADAEYSGDGESLNLKETVSGAADSLERVWELDLRRGKLTDANGNPSKPHRLKVMGKIIEGGDGDAGFNFSYSTSLSGPWTLIKSVDFLDSDGDITDEESGNFGSASLFGPIYIKVEDTNRVSGTSPDEIQIDCLLVETRDEDTAPFLGGGQTSHGRLQTNLCLYQSAYVGFLGALVEPTNVEKILQINLLATDFYRDPAYRTYLYYNPFTTSKTIQINVEDPATPGVDVVDVYDTVTHSTLLSAVSGTQSISIPAQAARVLVYMPAGGTNSYDGRIRKVNGVAIDYYYPVKARIFFDGFESNNFSLGGWTTYAYYVSIQSDAAYSSARGVRLGRTSWIEKAVSTVGYSGIYVKYRRATTDFGAGENLIVEWSSDGTTWNTLETVGQASYGEGLQNKSCGSSASNRAGFRIRFRTTASSSTEFATLDNIEVVGSAE